MSRIQVNFRSAQPLQPLHIDAKKPCEDSCWNYIIQCEIQSQKIREDVLTVLNGKSIYSALAPRLSALSVYRNGRAMDEFGLCAAQEQDDLRNLFRLGPFGKISAWHRLAIRLCVDNAGQNGIHAHA